MSQSRTSTTLHFVAVLGVLLVFFGVAGLMLTTPASAANEPITGWINGTVLDANTSAPIGGIAVRMERLDKVGGTTEIVVDTLTRDGGPSDGLYLFDNLSTDYMYRVFLPENPDSTPATHENIWLSVSSPVREEMDFSLPGAEGIEEGTLIRGPDGIKVWIVNAYGYKRHIFNPHVFNMYGHFVWENIIEVGQFTLDSFITSDFYRASKAANSGQVYSIEEVDEAAGYATKRVLDMNPERFIALGYFWEQIFDINQEEMNFYQFVGAIR